jgi:hypothetical protein
LQHDELVPVHTFPQAPQLLGSECVFAQRLPGHCVPPEGHAGQMLKLVNDPSVERLTTSPPPQEPAVHWPHSPESQVVPLAQVANAEPEHWLAHIGAWDCAESKQHSVPDAHESTARDVIPERTLAGERVIGGGTVATITGVPDPLGTKRPLGDNAVDG